MSTTLTLRVVLETTGEPVVVEDESGTGHEGESTEGHDGEVVDTHGAEAGNEAAEEAPNPILPVANELFWGATLFTILWVLMKWVLLPPIVKVMEQRDEQLRNDREEAERASSDAVAVREDYDAALAAARQEGARLVDDARHRADARRAELVAAAEADIAALRAEAATEVAAAKEAALAEVRGSVADLALDAAEAVIQKELDRGAQRAFVDSFVSQAGPAR